MLELVIPAAVRPEAVLHVLATKLDVVEGPPTTEDRVLLDSFDGRLRAAGLTLERSTTAPDEVWALTLRDTGSTEEHHVLTPPRSDRLLATELEEGRLRERLAPVLEERAVLPIARVTSRTVSLAVRNSDSKTVTRIVLEEPVLRTPGGGRVALDARLHVSGVLGYDKHFERVRSLLRDKIGLAPATRTLADEAAVAQGAPIAPGKLKFDLAPGMRTDTSAQSVFRMLAGHVDANLHGTIADLDPEFLHDLRVAIRRSRSVLREFKGAFSPEDFARAREELRWVQQVTGPTRDLDVALLEWPEMVATLDRALVADLAPLHALIVRHRESAYEQMLLSLQGTAFATTWANWRALLARSLRHEPDADRPDAARAVAAVAGERIRHVYAQMRKRGKAIDDDSPAEALHELRKRGKELRYLLELFGGLWPGNASKPLIKALKDLQDTLGRFQDRQVQAEFLRGLGPELAQDKAGPDALIALGFVIDRLAADQRFARAEFSDRFAAFAGDETRQVVNTAFGRGR